ncbi:GntR family transcriptional regulator [Micromonospora rosaria]|uniref:GntR family transcriptional regulator n=1 Tax=Micromonospora rosaria TaxID=47874 RepID=UPI000A057049|nr:GntR family transcriptional regulator [Micromonospora rosaria]
MPESEPRLDRPEALHQQVARNIRNDIESGILRDGEVLPTTRELAKLWGVSVFTISEAMRVLAEEGLVSSKSRSKRVVTAPDQGGRKEIRLRTPRVLIVGGFAGSGKTELGRIVARETGWPILDKDTLTRPVLEAALEIMGLSPNDRESEDYISLMRPREYESLMSAANENVSCGNSAIITAPFLAEFRDQAWLERVKATFSDMGAATTIVWVYCDASTMHTYIRHRGAARDAAKLADWAGYLSRINVEFRPDFPHILIDNCSSGIPLQTQARELVQEILGTEASES